MNDPSVSAPAEMERLQTEMGFISELCTIVAGESELQPILDWIVHKSSGLLGGGTCSIRLLNPDQATTHTVVMTDRGTHEAGTQSWPTPLKTSVMGFLLATRGELATSDLAADPRFAGLRQLAVPVRAILAVPLLVDGRITGMIAVSEPTPGREWTRSDVQLLNIVASHSAGVLEKTRLRAEAEQKRRLELEKEQMEKELLLARDIQMRLVPEGPFEAGPWLADGRVVPAKQVGGDYFDYFALGAERFAVVIADVSGKGVPAALLVSTVQGTLRAFANGERTPAEVIAGLNHAIVRNAGAGRFVTLCYAEIDHRAGRLQFVNAGHNWPLLRRRDGSVEQLPAGGMPLGLFEGATFEVGELAFAPGDMLLLYSDGITEAMDFFHQEFGEDRLGELWRQAGGEAPGAFVARLIGAVSEFRGAAPQSDDMTAVVIGAR